MGRWQDVCVETRFRGKMCGGVTKDRELVERWIAAKGESKAPAFTYKQPSEAQYKKQLAAVGTDAVPPEFPEASRTLMEIAAQKVEYAPLEGGDPTDVVSSGFEMVDFGDGRKVLAVRAAHWRSHLAKDAAEVIGRIGREPGDNDGDGLLPPGGANELAKAYTAYKDRITERLYCFGTLCNGEYIPILHLDGTPFTEPSGVRDAVVHAKTFPPRTCLKRVDYVEGGMMRFKIKFAAGKYDVATELTRLFRRGMVAGFGTDRGVGFGQYHVEFVVDGKRHSLRLESDEEVSDQIDAAFASAAPA